MKASPAALEPARDSCSAAYDLIWVYHLATWGLAGPLGGAEISLKTRTSACEGVYLVGMGLISLQSPRYCKEMKFFLPISVSRSRKKGYRLNLPFDIRPGRKVLFKFGKIYRHFLFEGDVWMKR